MAPRLTSDFLYDPYVTGRPWKQGSVFFPPFGFLATSDENGKVGTGIGAEVSRILVTFPVAPVMVASVANVVDAWSSGCKKYTACPPRPPREEGERCAEPGRMAPWKSPWALRRPRFSTQPIFGCQTLPSTRQRIMAGCGSIRLGCSSNSSSACGRAQAPWGGGWPLHK